MTYISCIILVTVLNVIIGFAAPAQDIEMLNSTQIVIHSVVASRILFNLRECEKCENERTFMSALAEFQDAHHPSFPLIEEPSQSSTSDSAESSLETQRQGRISNATNGCYSEPNLSSPPAVTVPGKDNVC
ncbi:hypothetical protein BV22DRAFT_1042228 [Leucogyrophana mollusca]|uniref:Uncharacterized protein n=1 Tax=Leucogyrophana mollusca TaxID=85980 RepID=A0ACB8AWW6_9AGAM|nr:hypothetical protein BV22DRAFT_1042228 [Leucogyrophana mollusca]